MTVQRIQVRRRRFACKVGNTFVGVWECGRRTVDGGIYYGEKKTLLRGSPP